MKKLILTILLLSAPAFAFEDYMIISNQPVKSVSVENPEILRANVLFTIDNQKKNIIISPQKIGKTKLIVNTYSDYQIIDVKVLKKKTFIGAPEGFNLFIMDIPPKAYNIPKPPVYKEKNNG